MSSWYGNKNTGCNWINNEEIQKYKSVNTNIIPSLKLTDLNDKEFRAKYKYSSFRDSCHWLIPNLILVGCDPYNKDLLKSLLNKTQITKFVSLHEYGHKWYEKYLNKYSNNINNIQLISFPICDFETQDDKKTVKFIHKLTKLILTMNNNNNNNKNKINNEKEEKKDNDDNDDNNKNVKQQQQQQHIIYMHCFGGHGRTGLISCLLLQAIYGMNALISIKFINEIHKMRHPYESDIDNDDYGMPESNEQINQIYRLNKYMIQIYSKNIIAKHI